MSYLQQNLLIGSITTEKKRRRTNVIDANEFLVRGILEGNDAVIKKFYKDAQPYVRNIVFKGAGDNDDVEDIMQDAMMVLYQKLETGFRVKNAKLMTYFVGICRNIWSCQIRQLKKVSNRDIEFFDIKEPNVMDQEDYNKEIKEALYRKCFLKLNEVDQKVLTLFIQGYNMKEMAQIMEISEGNLRKKKFVAKQNLLTLIERDPAYKRIKGSC